MSRPDNQAMPLSDEGNMLMSAIKNNEAKYKINNQDWLDEAIIYSAKHVGAWDDQLTKGVKNESVTRLYLDIPALKKAITAKIAEERKQELVGIMWNDTLPDAVKDALVPYIKDRVAELEGLRGEK